MQTYGFDRSTGRPLTEFGSSGVTITPILRDAGPLAFVAYIRLEPQGVIGIHKSVDHQLLIVVSGNGLATGENDELVEISEGTAIYIQPGELHETRAGENGLAAIVLEGERLIPGNIMKRINVKGQDES